MRSMVLGLFCLIATLTLVPAAPVWAHTLSVAHVDIAIPADGADPRIEIDLAIRDIALSLRLDNNRDERVTWGELQSIEQPLQEMVLSQLALASNGGACKLVADGFAVRQYDDGAYAALTLDAQCPSLSGLRLRYDLFFDVDPQHRAVITIRNGGQVGTAIARSDGREVAIGSGSSSTSVVGHPFLDFLREGIHHILIGYDHLAFLVSLLLPAVLVRVAGKWQPSPTLRGAVGHVLGIVTAFTVAHSITLSVAALDWVTPASRWVEAAIAASVLAAALNNIWPVVTKRLWLVGFAFGLVHGFGFAGALGELGLPKGARLWSLFGFNVGVELGQLAVVAVAIPVLSAFREKAWYPRVVMPLLSLALSGMAAWWLFERLWR